MDLNAKLRIGGVRAGHICFGICVTATVLTLLSAFTPLIMALYLMVLGLLVVVTLGTIFILVENFAGFFSSSTEAFASFSESATKALPYFCAVAVVTGVLAVLLLLIEVRVRKHTAKIVGAAVCCVAAVLLTLLSGAVIK